MRTLLGRVSKGYGKTYLATLEWDEGGMLTHIVTQEFLSEAEAVSWIEAAAVTYVIPAGTVVWENSWVES